MESKWEGCVRALLGAPNSALSSRTDFRYGNRGSLSVDIENGKWFDHEANEGGGFVSLVRRKLGCCPDVAVQWVRDQGMELNDNRRPVSARQIKETYDYTDEDRRLLFQVVRFEPKSFAQRKPDGRGGWTWSTKSVRRVLYRLPDLLTASPEDIIYVAEGEKDADRLVALGLTATTYPGGAKKWREAYAKSLAGRRVIVLSDNNPAGIESAEMVAGSLRRAGCKAAVLHLDNLPDKGDVSDWLNAGGDANGLHRLAEAALSPPPRPASQPTPLLRERDVPAPYPVDALGPLAEVAREICSVTQSPIEIPAQSVLAATSLACQALANVDLLQGSAPVSLFLLTVAASGERKSSADKLAMAAAITVQRDRQESYAGEVERFEMAEERYRARRSALVKSDADASFCGLDDIGEAPKRPASPVFVASDPTYEGVLKSFEEGATSIGIMSDEGGQFFGGHAMKSENRAKSAAGLSKLWDGDPVNRTRASGPPVTFYDRRVSAHLLLQPRIAEAVLGDPMLLDQGLSSRWLYAWPTSKVGYRMIATPTAEQTAESETLTTYHARIRQLLLQGRSMEA